MIIFSLATISYIIILVFYRPSPKSLKGTSISIKENSPSPEDKLINEQKLNSLKLKINKLKPHYREVIELKCFNELSYKEISKKLNQPVNNIKVKVLRAKKMLFELIKKEND